MQVIVPNPKRGSHEAYAVTSNGVYYMADSSVAAPAWVLITNNLLNLSLTRPMFGDATEQITTLRYLTALAVVQILTPRLEPVRLRD